MKTTVDQVKRAAAQMDVRIDNATAEKYADGFAICNAKRHGDAMDRDVREFLTATEVWSEGYGKPRQRHDHRRR